MSEPRKMMMWATWTGASYGHFGETAPVAVGKSVQAGGAGWTWERMQSVGWRVVPVTILPGHGES